MGNSPPTRAMADLPDDILADLLGRLSPRDQASSRCVCQAWRGIIDARRLLRADLLPLTLRGIFLKDGDYRFPPLFSRPSNGPAICDNLDDCIAANDMDDSPFLGHCNGLLLFWKLVVNPATGRWARFPPPPPPPPPVPALHGDQHGYVYDHEAVLAFDPTVSPYYQVFLVPMVPETQLIDPDLEWPPSPFFLRVFSSSTGRWDKRLFERETHGLPTMGTVAGLLEKEKHVSSPQSGCYSAFYRGRLYVQCEKGFVMRINTSSGTYHLLKRPMGIDASKKNTHVYIGKSKDGVYYAAVDYECRLQVWYLDESHSRRLKWVLKCDTCLSSVLPPPRSYHAYDNNNGPWFLRCYGDNHDTHLVEEIAATELEWSSDMEDFPSEEGPPGNYEFLVFLGFHPYKEVVFLNQSNHRGIAYHLNCSKIQDLGSIDYIYSTGYIDESFPYTPCWTGNL